VFQCPGCETNEHNALQRDTCVYCMCAYLCVYVCPCPSYHIIFIPSIYNTHIAIKAPPGLNHRPERNLYMLLPDFFSVLQDIDSILELGIINE